MKFSKNYPNPFNPTTSIQYDLPEMAYVSISIYDIRGRELKTLVNAEQVAGFKSVRWNATDNKGKPVSAGIYLYMIQTESFRQVKKMALVK